MDVAELRINNLVTASYEGELIVQGISLDHIYACKEIGLPTGYYSLVSVLPIPITEDYLIKFGCEKLKSLPASWSIDDIDFIFDKNWNRIFIDTGNRNKFLNYVHEFQNYYNIATSKELTIK